MITESQIAQVINAVLDREGGYVDNPDDPGGETNFGITQTTADEMGIGSVKDLTEQKAFVAYRIMFANWQIDKIPDYYTFALVADSCVNHGQGRGIRWLQQALGIVDDGVVGPQTLQAIDAVQSSPKGWQPIYASILAIRITFYGALIGAHPYNAQWAKGWLSRAVEFLRPWPWA